MKIFIHSNSLSFVKEPGESKDKITKSIKQISKKFNTLGEFIVAQHNLLPK